MSADISSTTDGRSALERATSLFRLQDPDPATDGAWELYTTNRLGAPNIIDESASDEAEEEEEWEEKEFNPDQEFSNTIKGTVALLERELGFEINTLSGSYKMLQCNVLYADINMPDYKVPEDITVMTRIYSLRKPLYIDVHFDYKTMFGDEGLGFAYRMGFKIHPSPAENDYRGSDSYKMKIEKPENAYISNGWRTIAYGHCWPEPVNRSEKVYNVFKLEADDVQNICDALWGPRKDLPDDADEETKIEYRRQLVNGVRVLLAVVGITSKIACLDSEADLVTYWLMGSIRSWFAREVRKVCGFELQRDRGQVSECVNVPDDPTRPNDDYYDLDGDDLYETF